MKLREYLREDAEGSATSENSASLGTTTDNIAKVETRVGDIIRRKKIEEGEELSVYTPFIAGNVNIAFYSNGRSDDEFSKCFDLEKLKTEVINIFSKKSINGSPLIIDQDEIIDQLEYVINTCCLHHHVWKFETFKQYGIQIVFGSDDTDSKVVVYQHFK